MAEHRIEVSLADRRGNEARAAGDFLVDLEAPMVTILTPSAGAVLGEAELTVAARWSDPAGGAGLDLGSSLVRIGLEVVGDCDVTSRGIDCPPEAVGPGRHGVTVAVRDLAGNLGKTTVTAAVDLFGPRISFFDPAEGELIQGPTADATFHLEDLGAGVDAATLQVELDGSPVTGSCALDEPVGSCFFGGLATRAHTLVVRVADALGHTSTAQRRFEVDADPPSLTIVAPPDGTVLVNELVQEVVVEVLDEGAGLGAGLPQVQIDGEILESCTSGDGGEVTCALPALPDGEHSVFATVTDLAGNRATAGSSFELITDTAGPLLRIVGPSGARLWVGSPPPLELRYSDRSGIDEASLLVVVAGTNVTSSCAASATSAACPLPALTEGQHLASVQVGDVHGNVSVATRLLQVSQDTTGPDVHLESPEPGSTVAESQPEIVLAFEDALSGVDPDSLSVALDGEVITPSCSADSDEASCVPGPLAAGLHELTVGLADLQGNLTTRVFEFSAELSLAIAITTPEAGFLTGEETSLFEGVVDPSATEVFVEGIPAQISGGTFQLEDLPLREGSNTVTVVARGPGGTIGTATVTGVRDTAAPRVVLQSPPDGFQTTSSQVVVTGTIADLGSSAATTEIQELEVAGIPTELVGSSFRLPEVLLVPGVNRIEARAVDAAGNEGTASVEVSYRADSPVVLTPVGGDLQQAPVGSELPEPLVVRLTDSFGSPLFAREVVFRVVRGDGGLLDGAEVRRTVVRRTDVAGMAQVYAVLGRRAGLATNQVEAAATGVVGRVLFTAAGETGPPVRIRPVVGADQTRQRGGAVGTAYAEPLFAQVFDAEGNPVRDVAVTFEVLEGGGRVGGSVSTTEITDRSGKVATVLTLGPEEGENLVEATFDGLAEAGALFGAKGLVPGPEEETRVEGQVLDPSQRPVPGVTIFAVGYEGNTTTTDAEGRFVLAPAPVGTIHLHVDGTTTTLPGLWPHLEFELTTVSGRKNGIGMPIWLPELDPAGARVVGGATGVVVPLPGVPGAELTVRAGSATFPDGSTSGEVLLTQVPRDNVPMVAPLGSNFSLAWTVQPPGIHFDPPAEMRIPNLDGRPGEVREFFSFDHDVGEFVSVGPIVVTEDGAAMVSEPGFGVVKAGWHGAVSPPPAPGDVCHGRSCWVCDADGRRVAPKCDECEQCNGGECSPHEVGGAYIVTDDGFRIEVEYWARSQKPLRLRSAAESASCRDVSWDWEFSTGQSESHRNVVVLPTSPGDVEVDLVVGCDGCPDAQESEKSFTLHVIELDLAVEGVPEDDPNNPDGPDEQMPGVFVSKRTEAAGGSGEDDRDLVEVELALEGGIPYGILTLSVEKGLDRIRVWLDSMREQELELPMQWEVGAGAQEPETPPSRIWLEGVEASKKREVQLRLKLEIREGAEGARLAELVDVLSVTVLDVHTLEPETLAVSADYRDVVVGLHLVHLDEEGMLFVPVEDGTAVEFDLEGGGGTLEEGRVETEEGFGMGTLSMSPVAGSTASLEATVSELLIDGQTLEIPPIVRSIGPFVVEPGEPAEVVVVNDRSSLPATEIETSTYQATVRDAHGNLVGDGTPIAWQLEGLGRFEQSERETLDGRVSATVRAGFRPESMPVSVLAGDVAEHEVLDIQPASISFEISPDQIDLDEGQIAGLVASITGPGGQPVEDGTPVYWTTSAGQIHGEPVTTGGTALGFLDPAGAGPGIAVVSVGTVAQIVFDEVEFVSQAGLSARPISPVIAGDLSTTTSVPVEMVDGSFEIVDVPASTGIEVFGPPGARIGVQVSSFVPTALYRFDSLQNGLALDSVGDQDGSATGLSLDTSTAAVGEASFFFPGGGSLEIPSSPALGEAGAEVELSLWVRPTTREEGSLLARDGQLELSLLEDGTVVAAVDTEAGRLEVASPLQLPLRAWSLVRLRLDGNRLTLAINGEVATEVASAGLAPSGSSLVVGAGFTGHLDELRVEIRTPGEGGLVDCSGLGPGGSLYLDQDGRGVFFVSSTGLMEAETIVETIDFALTLEDPSGRGPLLQIAIPVAVHLLPAEFYAQLWVLIRDGILIGEGESTAALIGELMTAFVPLLPDIRDIAREFSQRNNSVEGEFEQWVVYFAFAGIILDASAVVTFGGGYVAAVGVRALKTLAKRLGREAAPVLAQFIMKRGRQLWDLIAGGGVDEGAEVLEESIDFLVDLSKVSDESLEFVEGVVKSEDDLEGLRRVAAALCGSRAARGSRGTGGPCLSPIDELLRILVDERVVAFPDDVFEVLALLEKVGEGSGAIGSLLARLGELPGVADAPRKLVTELDETIAKLRAAGIVDPKDPIEGLVLLADALGSKALEDGFRRFGATMLPVLLDSIRAIAETGNTKLAMQLATMLRASAKANNAGDLFEVVVGKYVLDHGSEIGQLIALNVRSLDDAGADLLVDPTNVPGLAVISAKMNAEDIKKVLQGLAADTDDVVRSVRDDVRHLFTDVKEAAVEAQLVPSDAVFERLVIAIPSLQDVAQATIDVINQLDEVSLIEVAVRIEGSGL